ncbi:MAG TPA: YqcC family protein, partial [Phycisphaerae bacterium]|nr:YqcC family protein [Phycisphaerae bacterium]
GFFKKIAHVAVSAASPGEPMAAELDGGTLAVRVPLVREDVPPPTPAVVAELRRLNGMAAQELRAERVPGTGDMYSVAAKFVRELEAAMRQAKLWPGKKPPGEIEVRGAFGSENMAFNQWLAWVMIPRVKGIIESRGEFPSGSNVAAYAVREWDGVEYGRVVEVLRGFDEAVSGTE